MRFVAALALCLLSVSARSEQQYWTTGSVSIGVGSVCENDGIVKQAIDGQLSSWWIDMGASADRLKLVEKEAGLKKIKENVKLIENSCYRAAYQRWIGTAEFAIERRRKDIDLDEVVKALIPSLPAVNK